MAAYNGFVHFFLKRLSERSVPLEVVWWLDQMMSELVRYNPEQ